MAVGRQQQDTSYEGVGITRAIELLAAKDEQLSILAQRIKQLEKMVFGPRSSKRTEPIDPAHLLPFPHLQELLADVANRAEKRERDAAAAGSEKSKPNSRRGKGRRSLGDDIDPNTPRLRRVRKLTADECACQCGGTLREIREESSHRVEQLKLAYVDERVTTYYGCSSCQRVESSAPEQDNIVEGSILGPNITADLVFQRFANHTPYHRLEREFEQRGLPIDRTVISRNVLKCGELLEPVYEHLRGEVLGSFLVQIDDTPVVVRNGKQKGRTTGRIWVYRAPDGNVIFDFRMDRSQEGPRGVIGEFSGFVQGDAYSGHDFLFDDTYVRVEVGCWAHCVRKFRDARDSDQTLCAEFDVLFALLQRVEVEAKEMTPVERLLYRSAHARPVLDEIRNWLDARSMTTLPKSAMGRAIAYARNHWQALTNYLLDGRITDITNNAAERALRRVAVGRKNWMHIGVEEAGKPAVVLMSLIQTCVEHQVNAVEYLRDVLAEIGKPGSASRVAELTPVAWKRSQAAAARVAERRRQIANVAGRLVYRTIADQPP